MQVPDRYVGRRVVVVTKAGTVYGGAGTFTLSEKTGRCITLKSKRATVILPLSHVDTVSPIREEK